MEYNMDWLFEEAAAKGQVCAGLDTAAAYLPAKARAAFLSDADAVLAYNKALIEATSPFAACYKVQIAYYEAMGLPGLKAYAETLKILRMKKLPVIADIKRGDIADTAKCYADAHFSGDFEADFVTLSPYMGMDSIEPWLAAAEKASPAKGAFVLLRTSNKGMKDFEYQELKNGGRLYDAVGEKLAEIAAAKQGRHGYGVFGAVVGADPKSPAEKEEAAELRRRYGNLFFLIPGYGAQGGAAEDAALLLREGNGGVVNASRSLLKAWNKKAAEEGRAADELSLDYCACAAAEAARDMRDAIRAAAETAFTK